MSIDQMHLSVRSGDRGQMVYSSADIGGFASFLSGFSSAEDFERFADTTQLVTIAELVCAVRDSYRQPPTAARPQLDIKSAFATPLAELTTSMITSTSGITDALTMASSAGGGIVDESLTNISAVRPDASTVSVGDIKTATTIPPGAGDQRSPPPAPGFRITNNLLTPPPTIHRPASSLYEYIRGLAARRAESPTSVAPRNAVPSHRTPLPIVDNAETGVVLRDDEGLDVAESALEAQGRTIDEAEVQVGEGTHPTVDATRHAVPYLPTGHHLLPEEEEDAADEEEIDRELVYVARNAPSLSTSPSVHSLQNGPTPTVSSVANVPLATNQESTFAGTVAAADSASTSTASAPVNHVTQSPASPPASSEHEQPDSQVPVVPNPASPQMLRPDLASLSPPSTLAHAGPLTPALDPYFTLDQSPDISVRAQVMLQPNSAPLPVQRTLAHGRALMSTLDPYFTIDRSPNIDLSRDVGMARPPSESEDESQDDSEGHLDREANEGEDDGRGDFESEENESTGGESAGSESDEDDNDDDNDVDDSDDDDEDEEEEETPVLPPPRRLRQAISRGRGSTWRPPPGHVPLQRRPLPIPSLASQAAIQHSITTPSARSTQPGTIVRPPSPPHILDDRLSPLSTPPSSPSSSDNAGRKRPREDQDEGDSQGSSKRSRSSSESTSARIERLTAKYPGLGSLASGNSVLVMNTPQAATSRVTPDAPQVTPPAAAFSGSAFIIPRSPSHGLYLDGKRDDMETDDESD